MSDKTFKRLLILALLINGSAVALAVLAVVLA